MVFEDTNLKLTLISEDIKSYYTVRQLELENLTVSTETTTRQIFSLVCHLGFPAVVKL